MNLDEFFVALKEIAPQYLWNLNCERDIRAALIIADPPYTQEYLQEYCPVTAVNRSLIKSIHRPEDYEEAAEELDMDKYDAEKVVAAADDIGSDKLRLRIMETVGLKQ